MRTDPDVQRAVNSYQLGLPRMPVAGRSGELLGRGTGTSLEFQEYREYSPGDDIRRLDWAAYARSDTLMVRLYREEISPRTEILLDGSTSMTSAGPLAEASSEPSSGPSVKPLVARQLASVFALLSARLGGRPTVLPIDDQRPLQPVGMDGLEALSRLPFSATSTLSQLLAQNNVPMKRQAVRIVISDFLFPHDPTSLIRRLATDASTLWVLQILNAWEADPTTLGGRRLIDIETGAETDMFINRKVVTDYLDRLRHLQEELSRNCRRAHAVFLTLIADRGLTAICRNGLCAAGILRV